MLKMLLFPRHLITTSLSVAFYLTIFFGNEVESSVSGHISEKKKISTWELPSSSPAISLVRAETTTNKGITNPKSSSSFSSVHAFLAVEELSSDTFLNQHQSSRYHIQPSTSIQGQEMRPSTISLPNGPNLSGATSAPNPLSNDQLPLPLSPPSDGQVPLPPPLLPGNQQPPGPPSSSVDGQPPFPPSSSSGFDPLSPPSSSTDVQSPSPPSHNSGGNPPSPPPSSTDGQPPLTPSFPSGGGPPSLPSSSTDGQPPSPPSSFPGGTPSSPPSSSTDGQPPSLPSFPSGGGPPCLPSSSTDGQPPSPPSSSPGGTPSSPPSSSTDGQPPSLPSFPSGGGPPSLPSSSTDGQPPLPPSSSPGGTPSSPPSSSTDGQPPSPPSSSPGGTPLSPPSSTDGQPPLPPSFPSGGSPPSPPSSSTDGQLPSPPSSSSGGTPPSPPSSSTDGQPPSPPSPPAPGGGGISSGKPLTSSSSSTEFTTVPSPIGPAPDYFIIRTLRRKCSPNEVPTGDFISPQWDEDIRLLIQRCFISYNTFKKYSCEKRCGMDERSDGDDSVPVWNTFIPRCYCDKLCDCFGDCCFDFDAVCRAQVNPQRSPLSSTETCLALKNGLIPNYNGYAVWSTCPHNWIERDTREKCQDEDHRDLLRSLPVFDKDSHVTYRNIFCARCNGAVNTTYWKLKFDCFSWFNPATFNFTTSMDILQQNCSLDIYPEDFQLKFLKRCIPRFKDCHNVSQQKNESYCQTECLRYAFPVCLNNGKIRFRNPQCALCNGFKPSDLDNGCISGSGGVSPPLTILFDFSSTSQYNIKVQDKKGGVIQQVEHAVACSVDEVYDPYAGSCKRIVSPGHYNGNQQDTQTGTKTWNLNCTFIAFNKTDIIQLPNGSIYLKHHRKTYIKSKYRILDDKRLLCVNLSRNFTGTQKEHGYHTTDKTKTTQAFLQLLTSIGCIVSIVSLILLLVTYILFAELRNLPGKIIISLAVSLLLYQSVLFTAGKKDNEETCLAVAVLLHFFVLSSFTWMNVMAYDVHRIFAPLGGVAANLHGGCKKRFMAYCLYAWGSPAIIVLTCVVADHAEKGSIGYGQGEEECFISKPQAKLYSFVLPVALIMIFNLLALGHTVIHIFKTRKETRQVTNQRQRNNVAVICVKMASVMGLTWILGIVANLKALSFFWYPYVVLNSLQGLFIFLAFAVSGRALELYRGKLTGMMKKLTTTKSNHSNSNCTVQSTCSTATDCQDKQDTRL